MATSSSQIPNVSSSQNEDSKLARNLYIKTAKLEKELQNTLRRKSPLDKSISQLRQEIRTNYENIMFLDIAYAATKDIDQMLWKCVFYKPIEEFRKIIKKYQGSTEDPKAKEKLQKMTSSFLAFLDESSVYYEGLFFKFEEKYNQAKQQQPINQQLVKLLSTSLHKCLIILGDLARYVQLYNEKPTKDWTVAASHYSRALELMPSNGNPHNQLAVLATYQNDDCEAIYRYFRSLSVKKPFISARENLTILFEKNRQKFIKISTGAQSNGPNFARRKKKKYYKEVTKSNEEVRERFMVSFIRLHGILFTKTSVETFEEVLRNTLRDFEIACTFLTEEMILKLMIMNIFSVDNAAKNDTSGVILQYAVNLAYSTFATVVVHSLQQEQSLPNVGSVVTFLKYLRLHKDIIGGFKREAAYMFEKVAEFLNLLFNQQIDIPEEEVDDTEAILPEDAELFGFLPLQESKTSLSGKVNVSGDHVILSIRAKRIRLLAEEFVADPQFEIFYESGMYTAHSVEQGGIENLPTTQPQGEDQYDHNGFINPYTEFNEDAYVEEAVPENEIVAEGEEEFLDEENEQPRESNFVTAGILPEEENDEEDVEEDEVFVFKPEHGEAPAAASTVIDRPFGNHVGQHFAPPAPVPQQWNNSMMSHLMQNQQREEMPPPSSYYGASLFSPTNPTFFLGSNFYGQQPPANAKPPANSNNAWPAYHAKVIERPFQQPPPQQMPEAPNGRIIERPFGAPAPSSPFFGWGAYPMSQYPPQPAIPTMDILMNTSNAKNQQAQQQPPAGFNNGVFGFAQQNGSAQQTRGRNPFT